MPDRAVPNAYRCVSDARPPNSLGGSVPESALFSLMSMRASDGSAANSLASVPRKPWFARSSDTTPPPLAQPTPFQSQQSAASPQPERSSQSVLPPIRAPARNRADRSASEQADDDDEVATYCTTAGSARACSSDDA